MFPLVTVRNQGCKRLMLSQDAVGGRDPESSEGRTTCGIPHSPSPRMTDFAEEGSEVQRTLGSLLWVFDEANIVTW